MNDLPPEFLRVSAVITCHNQQDYIERAVRSVMQQDHPDLLHEIIVVDDGSTDQTASVLATLAESEPRLRIITQANKGVSEARNLGISEASGELVALLDGDDQWHPRKLGIQVPRMTRAPAARMSYSDFITIGDGLRRVVTQTLPSNTRRALRALFVQGGPILPSTMIFERALVKEIGGFDPRVRSKEDTEFCLRALSVGRARRIGVPLTYRTLHSESRSANFERKMLYVAARSKREAIRFPELRNLATQRRARAYFYCAYRMIGTGNRKHASRYLSKAARLLLRDPRGIAPVTAIAARQLRERVMSWIAPPELSDPNNKSGTLGT